MTTRCSPFSPAGAALFAGIFLGSSAWADGVLVYRAPAECAGEGEFRKAVEARGSRFDEGDTAVDVAIERKSDGFGGVLRSRRGDAASAPREVHGATCAEVVDALAVVAALALRPDAEAPLAAASSEPATPVAAAAPVVPEPPRQAKKPPRPPLKAMGSYPSPFEFGDRNVSVPAGTLTFGSVTEMTGFGGAVVGIVPGEVMPRIDFEVIRANFVTTPADQSYLVGPISRFRTGVLGTVTHREGDSTTEVGGLMFGAGFCFAPVFDSGGLVLLGCAEVAGTLVELKTSDASGMVVQSKMAGIATTGFALEAVYNLGRHFQLAMKVGGDVTINPLSAESADGSTLWRAGYVSGSGTLGLGGHW